MGQGATVAMASIAAACGPTAGAEAVDPSTPKGAGLRRRAGPRGTANSALIVSPVGARHKLATQYHVRQVEDCALPTIHF